MPAPFEFSASMADVTDEQHQNTAGLVQPDDFDFACVCLRASISYALEAAFWCIKAKR